jgi:intein/homing endonuclease
MIMSSINLLKVFENEESVYLYGLSKTVTKILSDVQNKHSLSIPFLSKKLNLNKRSIYHWKNGTRPIPLNKLLILLKETDYKKCILEKILINMEGISFGSGSRNKICRFPSILTPELSYFVGYLMGDGCLIKNKWTVAIFAEHESEIKKIENLLKKLFCLKGRRWEISGEIALYVYSKGLWIYLNKVFDFPIGKKKGKLKIPQIIKKSSTIIKKEFVKGFADSDGGIAKIENYEEIPKWLLYKPQIYISQSTKNFLVGLKIIMLELGLPAEGPYYNCANGGYQLTFTGIRKMKICKDFKIFRNPIKKQRLITICNLPR